MDAAYLLDLGGSNTKPSFFELAAQQSMNDGLAAAIKHLLKSLVAWRQDLFVRLLAYSDEIAFLLHALIQRHFLRKYAATISENFYGFKRVVIGRGSTDGCPKLSQYYRILSFFEVVVFPYLVSKIAIVEGTVASIEPDNDATMESSIYSSLKKQFFKLYPSLKMVMRSSNLVVNLLYIFGITETFSLGMLLSGLQLNRITRNDYELYGSIRKKELNARHQSYGNSSFFRKACLVSLHTMKDASRVALPFGLFFISFLSWWHTTGRVSLQTPKPTPPPPPPVQAYKDGLALPLSCDVCAICCESRKNPTAVLSSGFVFCYPCIYNYVKKFQRCPISFLPANLDLLLRVHS